MATLTINADSVDDVLAKINAPDDFRIQIFNVHRDIASAEFRLEGLREEMKEARKDLDDARARLSALIREESKTYPLFDAIHAAG